MNIVDSVPQNYFELRQQLNDYYNKNDSLKDQKGSGYKEFVRWTLFWDGRIDQNGSYTTANQNLFEHYEDLKKGGSPSNNLPFQPDWEALGPIENENPEHPTVARMGLVSSLWIDTTDWATIYAGSNSGGLFVTTDTGYTWKSLTDNIGALGIRDIIVNPGEPDTIFIATGTRSLETHYGYGILKSEDGGESWEGTALSIKEGVNRVVFTRILEHPDSVGCFYVVGNKPYAHNSYIFKTTDSFESVDTVLILSQKELFDIEFKPGDPSTIYASGHVLCKSTDWGSTWDTTFHNNLGLNQNHKIERIETEMHDDSAAMILAICEASYRNASDDIEYYRRLFRSFDNGNNFTEIITLDSISGSNKAFDVGYWSMELKTSPMDINTFYTGGLRTRKYQIINDTAESQYIPTGAYHVDVRELRIFSSNSEDIIWMGNDGGVTKSLNGGDTWIDCSRSGLNITQFYKFGLTELSPILFGGTQDGNFNWYNYKDNTWVRLFGDGGEVIIDYYNPDNIYFAGFCAPYAILKSSDGGESYSTLIYYDSLDSHYDNIVPLVMDPMDHNTIYLGLHDIHKSTDHGVSWEPISDFTSDLDVWSKEGLKTIAVSKTNPDVIYAGFSGQAWSTNDSLQVRLVRTLNGGQSWQDITDTDLFSNWGISDIEIHPRDPSIFWISFEQIRENYRVFRYEQYGDTAFNISDGLSPLTVNCLKYYENGDLDHLFAGTDVGVYYYNNDLDEWSAFNDSLPLSMVSDLEINYANSKLVASTFGRGMWQTDLPGCEDTATVVIRSDTIWEKNTTVCQNIAIDSGAVLTIKSDVFILDEDISFIVKHGAKLVIDSGSIRSGFQGIWEGIEVWGNPSLSQNPMNQGVVVVKNGGIVRDTEIAIFAGIRTFTAGHSARYNGGGIVYTDEAKFINNNSAIVFDPYNSNNISYINKSKFVNENNSYNYADFEQFIKLNSVTGVKIEGSIFENKDYSSGGFSNYFGIGIYSINSQIYIRENYSGSLPSQDTLVCLFRGLEYGIKALATSPSRTITVDSCTFNQNKCSIYLGGISYATVRRNHFELSSGDTLFVADTVSGIYLDACNGYQVEENEIYGKVVESGGGYTWSGIGIVINNSDTLPNQIYNNYFEDCYAGTIAQNQNRNYDGENGLQILCNDYRNCQFDIAVTADTSGSRIGIKEDQGSDINEETAPAGNTFTVNASEDYGHYYSSANKNTFYWHHTYTSGDSIIPTHKSNLVSNFENQHDLTYDKDDSCPSNINSSSGGASGSMAAMITAETKADSVQNLLYLLVDDGDTEQLTFEVQTSWPEDAMGLYNELIGSSPFLSDTVMISTVQKENVFPTAMVTDILSENPQSAKSDEVMHAVDQRVNQLTNEQKDQVNQGKYFPGAKESLESKYSHYISVRMLAINNILRYYYNDTANSSSQDSIISFLEEENQLWAEYHKAFEYLQLNDTTNSKIILNSIQYEYELNTTQVSEHLLYEYYFDIMNELIRSNKTIYEIDSSQSITMKEIFNASQGFLKVYSKNILISIDSIEYNEPYVLPDPELKTSRKVIKPVDKTLEESVFEIFPNPAHEYVIIEYKLESPPIDGSIEFYDSKGVLHKRIALINPYDYLVVDLSLLISGLYICRFIIDGEIIDTKKMSIIN